MDSNFWQLLLAAEVSPAKGRALIEALGPLACLDQEEFASHSHLTAGEASRVRACSLEAWQACAQQGVTVLTGQTTPARLTQLEDHPPALFAHGSQDCLGAPCLGIVGTRNASTYGRAVARKFATSLAEAGATIVSGGALGIDAAAHEGAIAAGGNTVAVLAGGIDKPYPSQNIGLFRRISESGCLISAYACGSLPQPRKFLFRNDLIAGLCDAVLVVEAPERSGALTTAIAAQRYGRPVFAVPSNIESTSFRGSHQLIRSGATLVDDPAQLEAPLGLLSLRSPKVSEPTSPLAARILAVLTTNTLAAEKLAELVDLPPQELMAELTMLELEGRVTRELGGYALVP